MQQREEWRPISETRDVYDVSNLGRVRRAAPGKNTVVGFILKPKMMRDGRAWICLRLRGVTLYRDIAWLVTSAFISPRPDGLEINHKNGHKADNRVANLEYVTHSENVRHAVRNGRFGRVKLTPEQARDIRASSESATALARRFDVCVNTVYGVRSGRVWSHV
jgi:hypothetical protein